MAPAEVVLLMKLIADRARDRYDVAALLDVVSHEVARRYVATYGPDYAGALEAAILEYERQAER